MIKTKILLVFSFLFVLFVPSVSAISPGAHWQVGPNFGNTLSSTPTNIAASPIDSHINNFAAYIIIAILILITALILFIAIHKIQTHKKPVEQPYSTSLL